MYCEFCCNSQYGNFEFYVSLKIKKNVDFSDVRRNLRKRSKGLNMFKKLPNTSGNDRDDVPEKLSFKHHRSYMTVFTWLLIRSVFNGKDRVE